MPDFFDRTSEQQIVLIDDVLLRRAEHLIESCEGCDKEAVFPFDSLLDWITRSDPTVTDYILAEPARCPRCRREILEKTLVHPESARIFSTRD